MNISINELSLKLVEAIRKEAESQNITQGAIAICYEPINSIAEKWIGLPEGATCQTVTFPIIPGEDTIYCKDGKETGDCAGIAAMKIAAARRAYIETYTKFELPSPEDCTSGALPEELVGNGRINWKGAIVLPIGGSYAGLCGHAGAGGVRIYVSVSGGTQDQDEASAWAALPVLKEVLNKEPGWMLARYLL